MKFLLEIMLALIIGAAVGQAQIELVFIANGPELVIECDTATGFPVTNARFYANFSNGFVPLEPLATSSSPGSLTLPPELEGFYLCEDVDNNINSSIVAWNCKVA